MLSNGYHYTVPYPTSPQLSWSFSKMDEVNLLLQDTKANVTTLNEMYLSAYLRPYFPGLQYLFGRGCSSHLQHATSDICNSYQ